MLKIEDVMALSSLREEQLSVHVIYFSKLFLVVAAMGSVSATTASFLLTSRKSCVFYKRISVHSILIVE